jgi:hypothetical protein
MENFYCADCKTAGELNEHLRCATCGSEAVVSEHNNNLNTSGGGRAAMQVVELEKLFRL